MSDCGHTDEEHAEMERDEKMRTIAEIMDGNFSSVFHQLPTTVLQDNIEALILEMFLRAPDDEAFGEYIETMFKGIYQVLIPEDGVGTHPETREKALELRANLREGVENATFKTEAEDELRVMFEQHGVAEDPRGLIEAPKKLRDDEYPGQYL